MRFAYLSGRRNFVTSRLDDSLLTISTTGSSLLSTSWSNNGLVSGEPGRRRSVGAPDAFLDRFQILPPSAPAVSARADGANH